MTIKFDVKYSILTLLSFILCAAIAIFAKGLPFIRGFIGDVLVVALIYYFISIFLNINKFKLALAVLIFAYTIEFLQYFNLVDLLQLGGNRLARIVIGTTFDTMDLLAYTTGFFLLLYLEGIWETLLKAKN